MLEALEVEKLTLGSHLLNIIWKSVKEEYSIMYKQSECMPDKIWVVQSVSSTAARGIYCNLFPTSISMNSGNIFALYVDIKNRFPVQQSFYIFIQATLAYSLIFLSKHICWSFERFDLYLESY